jgi:phage protein D
VNGTPLSGTIECDVTHNNHYRADTFSARLAIGADTVPTAGPYASSLTTGNAPFTASWWSDQDDAILIDVQMSNSAAGQDAGWISVLTGEVDDISVDIARQTISLTGRDLSRRLIDAKTQESFVNQTSSQIATVLAGRHRLSPNIQATTTKVGAYYQLEHDRIQLGSLHRATTEWNLLVWLAEQEGFDVWVSPFTGSGPFDATLNFQPTPPSNTQPALVVYETPPATPPYASARVSNLRLSRSMGLVKGVVVKVQSWNSKGRKAYTASAGKSGKDTQTFVFTRPNLSPAEAQAYANNMLTQITKHERKVSFEMPGELSLTVRDIIQISNTNTAFDQVYYIDSFTRRMSVGAGFMSSFQMKNQSPQVEGATTLQVR